MNVLVISSSLNPDSNSFLMAGQAIRELKTLGVDCTLLDLRQFTIPLCDGQACTNDSLEKLRPQISAAGAILLAVPIYNYDVNAAAKNLVEHTGSSWKNKIVGFLAAAGGHGSYMSVMSLANSLMLDFRCLIIPRFVYAVGADFSETEVTSPKIQQRIVELCTETARIAKALG